MSAATLRRLLGRPSATATLSTLALAACTDDLPTGPGASPRSAAAQVAVSAANGKIAFESSRDNSYYEIYVMNADGSGQTNLTNYPLIDDRDPAWSPDGSKIAFVSHRDGNEEIYVMNADGSAPTRLTTNTARDMNPAWSPDGSKLAFESNRAGNYEIYVMNADGSGQTNLTNNAASDFHPTWSSSGTKLAFMSIRGGNYEIYTMNADGSGQTNLTNNAANDVYPAWSPAGSKIAFASNRAGNEEIYVMNADGSAPTQLTTNAANDYNPAWSPDGTRLTFASGHGGYDEIYVMNADGSGQTQLTSNPAPDGDPNWGPAGGGGTNQTPDGAISSPAEAVTIQPGQSVSFAGSGTDPDGTIASYTWSFPGGSPASSTAQNPGAVTYATAGTYTATLTVTDNSGAADPTPATRTITVQSASSGVTVAVTDAAFTPKAATSPQGGAVTWTFQGPGTHNVTDKSGMALFASGNQVAGASYSVAFLGAGTYQYHCTLHPSVHSGSVKVPLLVSPATGTRTTSFAVTWASATAPSGYVYDVQLKRPGTTSFVTWKTGQTARSAAFVPDRGAGTYSFRARLRKPANGKASGWSPTRAITVR